MKDLQDEVKIQQTEIEGLTKLVELFKEEKKELTMDLTYVKMQLSFKEREIENLKKKMELVSIFVLSFLLQGTIHSPCLEFEI